MTEANTKSNKQHDTIAPVVYRLRQHGCLSHAYDCTEYSVWWSSVWCICRTTVTLLLYSPFKRVSTKYKQDQYFDKQHWKPMFYFIGTKRKTTAFGTEATLRLWGLKAKSEYVSARTRQSIKPH